MCESRKWLDGRVKVETGVRHYFSSDQPNRAVILSISAIVFSWRPLIFVKAKARTCHTDSGKKPLGTWNGIVV